MEVDKSLRFLPVVSLSHCLEQLCKGCLSTCMAKTFFVCFLPVGVCIDANI